MRNLPETPIIFLVYSPKSYFLAFWGAISIAIGEFKIIYSNALTGITSTNTRIWAQTEAYERHEGRNSSGLDRHAGRNSIFGRKSKLKFWS
jgi:hypothetical protein